jgi:hypothetical protein
MEEIQQKGIHGIYSMEIGTREVEIRGGIIMETKI